MAKWRDAPSGREATTSRADRRRRSQRRRRLLLGGGLAAAAGLVLWAVVAANLGSSTGDVDLGDRDRVLGDPAAPVTIVEYGDFKCPSCAMFFAQIEPRLREQYVDSGVVRLVWRDFANIDGESTLAARAGRCAEAQGRFWELHDTLYSYVWDTYYSQRINVEGRAAYEGELDRLADDAGLDVAAFRDCVDSGRYGDLVDEDRASGESMGVPGTPTFFVNGQRVVGPQPFEVFSRLIEAEADG